MDIPPFDEKNFYELWPNWIPTPHRVLANGFDDLADKENPSQCDPPFFKVASNFLNTNKFDKLGTIFILRKGVLRLFRTTHSLRKDIFITFCDHPPTSMPLRNIKMVPYDPEKLSLEAEVDDFLRGGTHLARSSWWFLKIGFAFRDKFSGLYR